MKNTRVKKPTVKRNYKRKAKPTIQKSLAVIGKGFPQKMMMTHKYFETFDMQTTAGVTRVHNFRANSMFAPNATTSGHQPFYYDQMAVVYNHYYVLGSKVTLTVMNDVTTNPTTVVALYLNDDTTVVPTYQALQEQNKARFVTVPTGSNDQYKIGCKYSAKQIYGGGTLANTDLKCSTTAGCNEQSIYTVTLFPHDLTSTVTLNCTVMIEYIVMWLELKDIAQS